MGTSWKEISRTSWHSNSELDGTDAREKTKIGSLQRIADATELMAKSYASLQSDRDLYKRWYENEKNENRTLNLRISALKGVITKFKKAAPKKQVLPSKEKLAESIRVWGKQ